MEKLVLYLDTLTKIQASGHKVDREIEEALRELRVEAGFEERDKAIATAAESVARVKVSRLLHWAVKNEVITQDQRERIENRIIDEITGIAGG